MLNQGEQEELARLLVATAEVMGDEARPNVVALMVRELSAHPLAALDKALATCRRELKGRLSLASILERIDDGHPGPNEAWAIALPAADERNTVVWTPEIQTAWAACLPLVQAGDKIAGRLAFIEAYTRQLKEARAQNRRGQYQPSMGFDIEGRTAAIEHAQALGLLSAEAAHPHLRLPPASPQVQARIEEIKQELGTEVAP